MENKLCITKVNKKVFKKAVNNIQKEILNMHVKSIISLWSSVASRQLSCHA